MPLSALIPAPVSTKTRARGVNATGANAANGAVRGERVLERGEVGGAILIRIEVAAALRESRGTSAAVCTKCVGLCRSV